MSVFAPRTNVSIQFRSPRDENAPDERRSAGKEKTAEKLGANASNGGDGGNEE